MFLPDPKTLSLAIGLANLLFAILASLYIATTPRANHPALAIWRWGRLLAGTGFIVNLLAGVSTWGIPAVVGNLLQATGAGFDLAAYCLLLERSRWERPLIGLVATTLAALLLTSWLSSSQGPRLIVFSAFGVIYYSAMAALMLRSGTRDLLQRVIGWADIGMGTLLLLRTLRGLFFAPIVRFDSDPVTLALYIAVFMSVIVNGFGFLLIARRRDDCLIYRALDELESKENEQQAWRQLLATVSHEFRTPATSIKMSLDSLRIEAEHIPSQITRRLDNIQRAANRLTQVSNKLITQERLDNPALVVRQADVDLCALVHGVLALYPPERRILTDLPETPVLIEGDPIQLAVALHNLIDNALEHTQQSEASLCVFLRQSPSSLDLGVADAGPGIPDADKPVLFDAFYCPRGHFTRGIGLSIVATVARNHGGEALVQDNQPVGAMIFIRLPLGGVA